MRELRLRLALQGPVGTPWQSDTLFGHLAWLVAQGRGPVGLEEFLAPFRAGEPPFVLSDGFPGDLLPRPWLPLPDPPEGSSLAEQEMARRRRKSVLVPPTVFQALRRGTVPPEWVPALSDIDPWAEVEVPHAAIHRHTGTTGGGAAGEGGELFFTHLSAPVAEGVRDLSVYLRATDPWDTLVPELLTELAALGYGRDRSVGVGAFELLSAEPCQDLAPLPEANGFVSLSTYCPAPADPLHGFWRVRLKYGKLGEGAGNGNPFKRPLVQMEPGAVFYTDSFPRPYYGRVVAGLAPGLPQALQCCYTLAVSCAWPADLLPPPAHPSQGAAG